MEFRMDDGLPPRSYDELVEERNKLIEKMSSANLLMRIKISLEIEKIDREIMLSMRTK